MTFFRDSKIDVYKKMWKFMESSRPAVFVKDYEQGIARVKRGGYAFLMESTVLDYVVQVLNHNSGCAIFYSIYLERL